jgi:transposase
VEFPRFDGHLTACAAVARKDGVLHAEDPTRVPRRVPPRGGADAACRPHPARAGREPGVSEQTLRNWRRQDQRDRHERDDGLTSDERDELRRLRRENARLKQERDLLKRAAAFFAADTKTR